MVGNHMLICQESKLRQLCDWLCLWSGDQPSSIRISLLDLQAEGLAEGDPGHSSTLSCRGDGS